MHSSTTMTSTTQTTNNTQMASPPNPSLKCLQINLHNCKAATAQSAQFIIENKIDIALIQDPYVNNNFLYGYPNNWIKHKSLNNEAWVVITNNAPVNFITPTTSAAFINLTTKTKQIIIGSQYCRPKANINAALDEWGKLIKPNEPIIIGADLNARHTFWGYPTTDTRGDKLIDFVISKDLIRLNCKSNLTTFDTGHSKGNPDFTIGNSSSAALINNWYISDQISLSDHRYILFEINEDRAITISNRLKSKFGNHNKFSRLIKNNSFNLIRDCLNVKNETELDMFTTHLVDTVSKIARSIYKIRKSDNKIKLNWWNDHLKTKRNRLRALDRRYRKCEDINDKKQLKTQLNKEQALYKRLVVKSKSDTWKNFCNSQQETYGAAFKLAHNKLFKPSDLTLKLPNNDTPTKSEALTYLTNYHFPPKDATIKDQPRYAITTIREPEINTKEARDALFAFLTSKAPGPDGIDFLIWRRVFDSNPNLLTTWINKCFELQHFPNNLKTASVVYFTKPGKDPALPDSYRPICLLPTLGKLLEKLINQRLIHHLEVNNKLHNQQFGFREGLSTESAIKYLLKEIENNKRNNLHSIFISLDIKGAFDSIHWTDIIKRLTDLKCPDQLINLINSYLSNRTVSFNDGLTTNETQIFKGCPQGSCLGPLLWLVIADIFLQDNSNHNNITPIAFVDDFGLIISGKIRKSVEQTANNALNLFSDYCKQYNLKISYGKCNFINFYNTFKNRQPILRLNGEPVKPIKHLKYLGLILDQNINWCEHINYLRNKSIKMHANLIRLAPRTWGIDSKMIKFWYKTVAEKTFTYGAAVWGGKLIKSTQIKLIPIQRPFLLRITRAFRSTSNAALNVLAGIPPLALQLQREAITANTLRFNSNFTTDDLTIDANNYQTKIKQNRIHPSCKTSYLHLAFPPSLPHGARFTIYTDGSKTDSGVGAAFCVFDNNTLTETHKYTLNINNTVFQAEIQAIQQALNWLKTNNITHAELHTDSLASMHALNKTKQKDPHVATTQRILESLSNTTNLTIHWVAAHKGNLGNETADLAAKDAAAGNGTPTNLLLPPSYLKRILNNYVNKQWQNFWQHTDKGSETRKYFPQVSTDRLIGHPSVTQLLTGHGFFPQYLFNKNLIDTPYCPCDQINQQEGTPEHYMYNCHLTSNYHFTRPQPQHLTKFADGLNDSNYQRIKAFHIIEQTKSITNLM